jgi:hypothetical protein
MSKALKLVPVFVLAAGLFGAGDVCAQSAAGKWNAEYPTRVRMGGGGAAEAEQLGQALLTLEVKGDSVFGSWAPQNTPAPMPARSIKGTFKDGRLNLVSEPTQAKLRRSGAGGEEESTITMVTYFEGSVKDGAIEGTMYSESDDHVVKSSPIKWTAKLAK